VEMVLGQINRKGSISMIMSKKLWQSTCKTSSLTLKLNQEIQQELDGNLSIAVPNSGILVRKIFQQIELCGQMNSLQMIRGKN